MKCLICSGECSVFTRFMVLQKYDVPYWRCQHCDFVFAERPTHWLAEAYGSEAEAAIVNTDVGLLRRNIDFHRKLTSLLWVWREKGRGLDLSGGYGVFTRLMRDSGFEYYWQDPYAKNIFAAEFAENHCELDKESVQVLSAWEVMEHLPDPEAFLREKLAHYKQAKYFFFSTEIFQGQDRDWWYFCPEKGQHISFFSASSLAILAQKLGLHFYQGKKGVHLFSRQKIAGGAFLLNLSTGPLSFLLTLPTRS